MFCLTAQNCCTLLQGFLSDGVVGINDQGHAVAGTSDSEEEGGEGEQGVCMCDLMSSRVHWLEQRVHCD